MDIFHWVAVVLSTMLGLGIARLLSGFVIAFKSRHRGGIDWLPLSVAGIVLGEILQFWWALAELATRPGWSLGDFSFLVLLVMLLFLAAALIVPTDTDVTNPSEAFARDGRWALLLLALYHGVAIAANGWFWNSPLRSVGTLLVASLAVTSAAGALIPGRAAQSAVVIVYCVLAVTGVIILSPIRY
ncbi:hypothetical protein FHS55_002178 [Angulomicrobium tetraedrale]|uniref:Uncharacterized protein n=1 Tax=Ancylobacter tetraedralis TaxID=217068 RepID=A0A839ZA19_9HYPH|nr:hypothetical protein [Ancylobacter tetraedralis]MBB3771579.1 hypothetical protein [Ancylobacter tetraedralis]